MKDPHIILADAKETLLNSLDNMRKTGVVVSISGVLNLGGIHLEIKA